MKPKPVAAGSNAYVCGGSLAGIVFESCRGHGCLSLVNIVCCKRNGLCDGPNPRPEEWYRLCVCVCVCVIYCD